MVNFVNKLNVKIMKKIAILTFLLFVIAASGYSQNEKFFRFGIHGSPSLAWLKPGLKEYEHDGFRLGFGYGLITEFSLADNYSFTTGLESNYSGGKLKSIDTLGTTTSAKYKVQYLEIPVALKMKTNEINYITYFAKFGGAVNMRLNSLADYSLIDSKGEETVLKDRDIAGEVQFFRVAFHIGVGIEYSLGGTTAFLAGVNFNNGLTNMFRGKDVNVSKDQKANGNFISLNLGILF
jgi:hypothetical protein